MVADISVAPLTLRIVQGLNKIGLAIKARAWERASETNLPPTQAQILAILYLHGALRLSRIADELAVTPATASDSVSSLAAKKLVVKRRHGGDARALAIGLTAAGRKRAMQTVQWPDFLTAAVDTLSPDEQLVFHRGLVKMIRALQDRRRVPVARMCVNCRFFRPGVHSKRETPHHCDFVDAPFGDRDLRIDCREFQGASTADAWHGWVATIQPARSGPWCGIPRSPERKSHA